ncbi:MARH3 ligase, partial [Ardeotis kori]|nr:MARH3 ligase [Ardeotis kori]
MRTSRCGHLLGVPPERLRPPAPNSKTLPGGSGSGPAGSCPQYVMQVERLDHSPVTSNFLSSSSSPFNERPICRICHESSSQEDLLSPCECTGTLGTIHRSCLEHWLSSSNTSYCELCHFRFAVERKPRPLVE